MEFDANDDDEPIRGRFVSGRIREIVNDPDPVVTARRQFAESSLEYFDRIRSGSGTAHKIPEPDRRGEG